MLGQGTANRNRGPEGSSVAWFRPPGSARLLIVGPTPEGSAMSASTPRPHDNSRDAELRRRARSVIPGGLWGHLNAANLPDGYPQFFERGEGCRIVDVDGREFVDFMCSWGPIVLGHHHPGVEAAAQRQAALGDTLNGPAPVLVDLAELMVAMIPHAAWCMFEKNGGDATTAAVTIARAGTGRRKLLVARGSYHGAVPWCSPSLAGVTAEDRAHILHYDYNDVASLETAVDQAGGDLAAIIVTAFRHDMGRALELPDPVFARRMRELCDAADAALILDDVRAGFRLALGGSWETIGVRPDLSAFSKAIANGYPLGAITGESAGGRRRRRSSRPGRSGARPCRWRRPMPRSPSLRVSTAPP